MFKIYKVELIFYEGLRSAAIPSIVDCSGIDSRVWQWGLAVSLLLCWKEVYIQLIQEQRSETTCGNFSIWVTRVTEIQGESY